MLGFFLATVIYLIRRCVRSRMRARGNAFTICATISMLPSIGSVFLLLLFVHHLSRSIVTILSNASAGTSTTRGALPAERDEETQEQEAGFPRGRSDAPPGEGGYVQAIDFEQLKQRATEAYVLLYLNSYPGQFLLPQDHGRIFPACRSTDRLLNRSRIA